MSIFSQNINIRKPKAVTILIMSLWLLYAEKNRLTSALLPAGSFCCTLGNVYLKGKFVRQNDFCYFLIYKLWTGYFIYQHKHLLQHKSFHILSKIIQIFSKHKTAAQNFKMTAFVNNWCIFTAAKKTLDVRSRPRLSSLCFSR